MKKTENHANLSRHDRCTIEREGISYETRRQRAMRRIDKISEAAKRRRSSCRDKWPLPMRVRITSLALALAFVVTVAFGSPLHSSDRGCMPIEMKGCEHMGMDPNAHSFTSVPLCCLINCQEPGPLGSAFTVQSPTQNGAFLSQVALAPTLTLPKPFPHSSWLHSASFTPPETYLKNLALLI